MTDQVFRLPGDWENIKERFKEHFREKDLVVSDDEVIYKRNSVKLKLDKERKALGKMPLHENKIEGVKSVRFSDSEVIIISEDSKYVFRR